MTAISLAEGAVTIDVGPSSTEAAARMSFGEVIQVLIANGLSTHEAAQLYRLFEQLGPAIKLHEKTGQNVMGSVDGAQEPDDFWEADQFSPYIAALCMSSRDPRHAILDRIMPDLATAAPGSAHEALERGLLKPGDHFMHDRIGSCVIAVRRDT